MRLAHLNGWLWASGNWLVSTSLVSYLALEFGARGIGISLILAAPHLVGVLRLVAPALLACFDRRRFCLAMFAASALTLLGLPLVAAPRVLPSADASLAALVGLWALYHLLQYLGTVALWSWLGDVAPHRIRGRFLGHRERWMLAGTIPAMVASGWFAHAWRSSHEKPAHWLGYAIPAALGALAMLAALAPLARLPSAPLGAGSRRSAMTPVFRWSDLAVPFRSPGFWSFVAFGMWFSAANGLTQSAQFVYPASELGFGLFLMLALQSGMRLGQWAVSPWAGWLCDRWGNRPVLAVSQGVQAAGLLCYAAATPEHRGWIAGAWVLWIAFAGLNVGLPNLMLELAPPERTSTAIALYFATTSLAYGLSTILGGWLFDQWSATPGYYVTAFVGGWLVRSLGVLWLAPIRPRDVPPTA